MKKSIIIFEIMLIIIFIIPTVSASDNMTYNEKIDEFNLGENALKRYDMNNLKTSEGGRSALSDLQSLIDNHIGSNTILYLDKNYSYNPDTDSGLTEGIIINKTITINGNGYSINANEQSRIFNLKGSGLVIALNNITFMNGNANNGGAIYHGDENPIDITIKNCNFKNNTALNDGGAIHLKSKGLIIMENNNFSNNIADFEGGAIYSTGENMKISNSNFTANTAKTRGGALSTGKNTKIYNSIFQNNHVSVYGGAISTGENSNVINSTFINNTAENSGGAINVKQDKKITIADSYFIGNVATNEGGAIKAGSTIIINSNFTNNKAHNKNGGAVYLGANSKVEKSTFSNNTANNNGGAVYLGVNSKVEKSIFSNNTANNNGGAIYSINGLNISDSDFNNNFASKFGGAVSTKNIEIKNCEFNNNNAGNSGGSLKIDGTTVLNNVVVNGGSSGYHGGFLWTDIPTAIISNLTVIGTTSKLSGGGAYFTGNVKMTNSRFYNNTATATIGRSEGGAINFGYLGDNLGSSISDSIFMYNKAYKGSAILAEKKFNLTNTILLDNQANIDKLIVEENYPNENQITINVRFAGHDNLINSIFTRTDSYSLNNVTYLKNHEFSDDDKKTTNEIYQNVTIEVYNQYNDFVNTFTVETDNNGIAHFDIDINEARNTGFIIYHKEDNYYTEYIISLNKKLAYISCESENITYSESKHLIFKVYSESGNIPTGNISVNLTGGNGKIKNYVVNVGIDGFAYLNITDLDVDEYNVSVRYNGDNNHLPVLNTTFFKVSEKIKNKTSLNISVNDIYVGENAIIELEISPRNVEGNIHISVDNRLYTAMIKDGKATIQIPNLTAGEKTVNVSFLGNENYTSSSSSTIFNVNKHFIRLTIDCEDIEVGKSEIIKIRLPYDANGSVSIIVDGEKYTSKAKNGKVIFKIPNLKSGKYTIKAIYNGDSKYLTNETSDKFKVFKINPQMQFYSFNDKTGMITINLSKDATGKVIIEIEGKKYVAIIKNGKSVFYISNLNEGEHRYKITYWGDDKYYPSEIEGYIEINQKTASNNIKTDVDISIKATGNTIVPLLMVLILLCIYPLKKLN